MPPTPTIAAVLEPQERSRVDAAGNGYFSLVHRESVRDAIRVVRERPVDAILVSVGRCAGEAPALLEQFARAFPAIPTVALLSAHHAGSSEALLRLGATGVRRVVDTTDPAGWRRLREVLGAPPTERAQTILTPVLATLAPLPGGSQRFWEELCRSRAGDDDGPPTRTSVGGHAVDLRVALRARRLAVAERPPGGGAPLSRGEVVR